MRSGLIVSCQVPAGTAIDKPEFIAAQALTVLQAGAIGIRAEGLANVAAVASVTDAPIIGLVKRHTDSTPIYITPTVEDVLALEKAGATVIAFDATERLRADGVDFKEFMAQIKRHTNIPLLADIDTVKAAVIAEALGCDAVATTLAGYTDKSQHELPNIKLIEELSKKLRIPIIAEGGFSTPEDVRRALDAGAIAVCVGTAITNPFLLTKNFVLNAFPKPQY